MKKGSSRVDNVKLLEEIVPHVSAADIKSALALFKGKKNEALDYLLAFNVSASSSSATKHGMLFFELTRVLSLIRTRNTIRTYLQSLQLKYSLSWEALSTLKVIARMKKLYSL